MKRVLIGVVLGLALSILGFCLWKAYDNKDNGIVDDNKNIELPNGTLSNSNITNYTANPKRRLDLEFEVGYNTKIDKVKKVIKEVIDNEELILKDEPVTIRLSKHGSSSLVFAVKVWTKTENYYDVLFNLEENIKETFDKNKIEIPYSQLDVHLKNK